jgi:hypothetical protein
MMSGGRASWRAAVVLGALCVLGGACGRDAIEKPMTITRPAADAPFDGTFTWTPVARATRYHLVVFSPTGTRAFEVRDLTSTAVKLSEGVQLPPGRYSAQVTAVRDGAAAAESAPVHFEIKN